MTKWLRALLTIIGILLLICAYTAFQSYVNNSPFYISLDIVLITLIGELWKLISAPTVFVALLALLLLWTYKARLEAIIPALKELSAGPFSARFDPSGSGAAQLRPPDTSVPLVAASPKEQDVNKNEPAQATVQDEIARSLSKEFCQVLLAIDDKVIEADDFVQKLDDAGVYAEDVTTTDKKERRIFYSGVFRTFYRFVMRYLVISKRSDDMKTAHLNLKPGVRELLEARLKELEAPAQIVAATD